MSSIEDRITKLEEAVFGRKDRTKNWRSTVGKFDDDPFMDDVIDGALKKREEERCEARKKEEECDSQ